MAEAAGLRGGQLSPAIGAAGSAGLYGMVMVCLVFIAWWSNAGAMLLASGISRDCYMRYEEDSRLAASISIVMPANRNSVARRPRILLCQVSASLIPLCT